MPRSKLAPYRKKGVIARYLAVAARDPDPEAFVIALAALAKAKGMAQVAKDTGLGRESLNKALVRGAKPRYETVRKLVEAFGLRLTVETRGSVARSRMLLRAAARRGGRMAQLAARGARGSPARSAVRFRR